MKVKKYKESVYTADSPELTINLREIMLNSEGYYKIDQRKTTDLQVYTLYWFAILGFISLCYCILFYLFV